MSTRKKQWYGWHFATVERRLGYGDDRQIRTGRKLSVKGDGPLVLCERGMHASKRPIDALAYAPGPVACFVMLSGLIVERKSKAVAESRTVLAMADATRTLHEFALWCATRALARERKAGHPVDSRSENALAVKRRWLDGGATDAELAAAGDAAWAAAGDWQYGRLLHWTGVTS